MSTFFLRRAGILTLAFASALGASSAQAAWSTDPTNPLLIAQHNPSNQTVPHMVPTPDGGFYVSWVDYGNGASIRLQRLDAAGNAMWGTNGILAYQRNEQYNFDYGLDVDTSGNALLAFDQSYTDAGSGSHLPGGNIVAIKIDPSGNFVWGSGGVTVSPTPYTAPNLNAQIGVTSDGNAVVGWLDANGNANYQKLAAADGSAMWPATQQFTGYMSHIHGSDTGNAIISLVNNGVLETQKLASADGSSLWNGGSLVVLSDGQSSTGTIPSGYFPDFISDGAGGAVFAYQVDGSAGTAVRVQHVASTGAKQFTDNSNNGVSVSTNNTVDVGSTGTHNQDNPAAAYDATTGDIYVSFEDWFPASNDPSATFIQRISSAGSRQWTDAGMALENYIPFGADFSTVVPVAGGVIVGWSSAGSAAGPVSPTNIVAQRLNADGSYAWSSTPTAVKTASATTSRLSGVNSANGYAAFVWNDNDSVSGSGGDIRAQNLRYDSLLGAQVGLAPGVPALTAATDSGSSNSDGITNNPNPQFAGTCNTVGDSVGLALDGTIAASGACTASGYAITLGSTPADGTHAVTAYEYNASGASPYSTAGSFTMDATAPIIAFTTQPANPSSASDGSFVFSVSETATVQCNLDSAGFAACVSPFNYSGLLVGTHTFTVTAIDVAGNVGTTTYNWTIAPGGVTVYLDPSTDSGRSNSDGITNANPLLFNGSCTDGDTIKVFAGAATLGTVVCSGGTFSVSNSTLGNGKKSIFANATRGGVTGPNGPALTITIIRTPPAAPVITGPASAGASAIITGTAAINAIVTVSVGNTFVCGALADSSGSWSCNAVFSTAGANTITATATDVAGNVSVPSAPFTVTMASADLIFRDGFGN